jgi:WD40 repeat protein
LITRIVCDDGGVRGVAFSADGTKLMTAGNSMRTWEVATGRLVGTFSLGRSAISALIQTPNGEAVGVVQQSDQVIRIYDFQSGKKLKQFDMSDERAGLVAISRDGSVIASGSSLNGPGPGALRLDRACKIAVWNAKSEEWITDIEWKCGTISGLGLSRDGRYVAATASGKMAVWETRTGRQVIEKGTGSGSGVVFLGDGETIATGVSTRGVDILRTGSGENVRQIDTISSPAACLYLSPDGAILAVGERDGVIRLVKIETGEDVTAVGNISRAPIVQGAVAHNGKELVVAGRQNVGGGIVSWNLTTNKERAKHVIVPTESRGGDVYISGLAVGTEGKVYLAANSRAYSMDLPGKQINAFGDHPNKVWCSILALSPDQRFLATTSTAEGRLSIWDVASGKRLQAMTLNSKGKQRQHFDYNDVAWSPDGLSVVVGAIDHAAYLNTTGIKGLPPTSSVEMIRLEPASDREVTLEGQPAEASKVCYSPDGRFVSCLNGRNGVYVWHLDSGKLLGRFQESVEGITSYAFSPDGGLLAIGDEKGVVTLWEVMSRKRVTILSGHGGRITVLDWSAGWGTLISGSEDGTAIVWDPFHLRPATPVRAQQPADRSLDQLWTTLGEDAESAHAATITLRQHGARAVDYLVRKIEPGAALDPEEVNRLIVELNHEQFTRREAASRRLREIGPDAGSLLRQVTQRGEQTPEMRRRVGMLLEEYGKFPPERLRRLRGIRALEMIGTPAAVEVLKKLTVSRKSELGSLAADAIGRLEIRNH